MRKALVVGINHYNTISPLFGCVDDAHKVRATLEVHSDGSPNFDVRLLTATGPGDLVDRDQLRGAIEKLFQGDAEVALLYFAGHGYIETTGGYLCASDTARGHDGIALNDVLQFANDSSATNRVIMLDSCHSGIAGTPNAGTGYTELKEGVTVLTASTAEQYATEDEDGGIFTHLMVDALNGGAADLLGRVTPGSVYAHIDQSLGAWEQRPVFKTNVKRFVFLRKVAPAVPASDLRRIVEFFPRRGIQFALDPTFEPERDQAIADKLPSPDAEHCAIFAILQKFNRVGLVEPIDAPHMYYAAMNSTACRLTALGEHYRRLAEKRKI